MSREKYVEQLQGERLSWWTREALAEVAIHADLRTFEDARRRVRVVALSEVAVNLRKNRIRRLAAERIGQEVFKPTSNNHSLLRSLAAVFSRQALAQVGENFLDEVASVCPELIIHLGIVIGQRSDPLFERPRAFVEIVQRVQGP